MTPRPEASHHQREENRERSKRLEAAAMGIRQQDSQIWTPSRAADTAYKSLCCCQHQRTDHPWLKAQLRYPGRVGRVPSRHRGADPGPQAKCNSGEALPRSPHRSASDVAHENRAMDPERGRNQATNGK